MRRYHLNMEESFEVNRNQQECFRYISDFSTLEEWDHTVSHSEKVSEGSIQKGTIFNIVLKFGIRNISMKYRITAYEYPNKAILEGDADGIKAIDTIEVFPINSTTSKIVWKAEITFTGLLASIIPYMETPIKKSGAKTIQGLQSALENNFPAPNYKPSLKMADGLVLPGLILFSKYGYQWAKKDWHPNSASVVGKHIVLTGATSGLGLATAEMLAHKGAHLTLIARDKSKAEDTRKKLIKSTGNENIVIELADLSLLKDVYQLTERLLQKGKPIDVLINNAGALFNERNETSEGIERSFALLLLAPYYLTNRLTPLLQKSEDARVINVSSGGMYTQSIKVEDLEFKNGKYNGSVAYARAKRGLMIITEQWAKQHSNGDVVFNAMHPGWADTPGVEASLPGFYKLTKNILRTPTEGADTIEWLATATEANQLNGQFLLDRRPHTTHLLPQTKVNSAKREELIRKLDGYVASFEANLRKTLKT